MNRFATALWLLVAPATDAESRAYDLKVSETRIHFTYDLQGSDFASDIPIRSADLVLDFDRRSRLEIAVSSNILGSNASFAPLTESIKSESVLGAQFFRARGKELGNLGHHIILLTGDVDRQSFYASEYAGPVCPAVELRILVSVKEN